jgi:hypothetical protein
MIYSTIVKASNFYLKHNVKIYIIFFAITFIMWPIYIHTTSFTKKITVDKTYNDIQTNYGSRYSDINNSFMVHATDGHIYEVSNSFWLWEWNDEEQWGKLKKGQTYIVKGYGKKVGMFHIHPQIVSVKSA